MFDDALRGRYTEQCYPDCHPKPLWMMISSQGVISDNGDVRGYGLHSRQPAFQRSLGRTNFVWLWPGSWPKRKLETCHVNQFCLFPTCQVRVVRFLDVMTSSFLPSSSCSPDITCQLVIAVRLAGLHLPPRWTAPARSWSPWVSPDFCSATVSVGLPGFFSARKSLWALPGFLRLEIAVGFAGHFAPRKNAASMSDKNVRSGCQKKCHREWQMECQIKCQRQNARLNAR